MPPQMMAPPCVSRKQGGTGRGRGGWGEAPPPRCGRTEGARGEAKCTPRLHSKQLEERAAEQFCSRFVCCVMGEKAAEKRARQPGGAVLAGQNGVGARVGAANRARGSAVTTFGGYSLGRAPAMRAKAELPVLAPASGGGGGGGGAPSSLGGQAGAPASEGKCARALLCRPSSPYGGLESLLKRGPVLCHEAVAFVVVGRRLQCCAAPKSRPSGNEPGSRAGARRMLLGARRGASVFFVWHQVTTPVAGASP